MEIRQLEYFVTSVKEKSFYKASQKLFTSQPAISKSIGLLEKEIGAKLFERTSKGIIVTPKGEQFYHYANNVLKQVEIMQNLDFADNNDILNIASYPSKTISKLLTSFYGKREQSIHYREGSVQDIIDFVSTGICEFGLLYVSPKQEHSFAHIISHKQLEFVPIKKGELCVYVGKEHEFYKKKKDITIEELSQLQYIRGLKDFFSVEHHFDFVSLNEINTSYFKDKVLTNSDHLVSEMLNDTTLCYLGIDLEIEVNDNKIVIDSDEKYLTLGYVKNQLLELNDISKDFLEHLQSLI
ncbi:LysR family transcriptional regulator [Chakrabartyella piscis]|uniref:LysR family transcriptional regulator n=1 Tax=Chakrabartyella piscis TaxID=2918914 RepID=UPI0029583D77|nr:LysR family transcriptional regulator [Chakrabartyella piscis]